MVISTKEFSSKLSMEMFSMAALKDILEHVSSNNLDETIKKINEKHKKIAKDCTQPSCFLLTSVETDHFLTIYIRKGTFSSSKISNGMERKKL